MAVDLGNGEILNDLWRKLWIFHEDEFKEVYLLTEWHEDDCCGVYETNTIYDLDKKTILIKHWTDYFSEKSDRTLDGLFNGLMDQEINKGVRYEKELKKSKEMINKLNRAKVKLEKK